MNEWYREDLAYIHDFGFGDYAPRSVPGTLQILDRNAQGREDLVVFGLREWTVCTRADEGPLPRSRDRHLRSDDSYRAEEGAGDRVSGWFAVRDQDISVRRRRVDRLSFRRLVE